jgi:hypothetical protein
MFTIGLPKKTKECLEELVAIPSPELSNYNLYLGGGTALSMYIPYRYSYDFDLFTDRKFVPRSLLGVMKQSLSELSKVEIDDDTLKFVYKTISFSFFYYPYELIEKSSIYKGLSVASVLDIALMKITAISNRGMKKDFYDLYYASKELGGLDKIIERFPEKYKDANRYHYLKGLLYFADADKEPDPNFVKDSTSWTHVKEYFKTSLSYSLGL